MRGLHLLADLQRCACALHWLTDAPALLAHCKQAAQVAGLRVVGEIGHAFDPTPAGPGGVTVTLLLAESHLCVHTWPERQAVTLDVYVCNLGADHSPQARALFAGLLDLFEPAGVQQQAIWRGLADQAAAPARWPSVKASSNTE